MEYGINNMEWMTKISFKSMTITKGTKYQVVDIFYHNEKSPSSLIFVEGDNFL